MPEKLSLNDIQLQLKMTQQSLDDVIEINKEIKVKNAKKLADDVANAVSDKLTDSVSEKVEEITANIINELTEKLPENIANKVIIEISKVK